MADKDHNTDNLFLFDGDPDEFYEETDLDASKELAERQEIEEELRRLRHWEEQIAAHEAHAQAHIERESQKAHHYLDKATRSLRQRAAWHRNNIEWWLRRQPDNVRSEQFINGKVKRRKGRHKVIITDEAKAISYLRDHAPDILRKRSENWEEIDRRKLLEFVRHHGVNELFQVETSEDSYTVETHTQEQ